MTKYFLFLFSSLFLVACGSDDSPKSSEKKPEPAKVKKAINGKKIFQTYCVACHGLYGDMEVNGAKDLNLSILSVDERIEIITNGKNVMTPFGTVLSEAEIKAVAEYTKKSFKQ